MENTKQKYHNKYRVPSARADWHDYNGGAYFITICTKNREHFFGEIENGEMILSEIGEYADKNISEITQHNCYAEIPLWIVMPDHIHMVVIIDDTKTPHEKRAIDNGVETFPETSQYSNNVMKPQNSNKLMKSETFQETSLQGDNRMSRVTQMQSWLSVVIRQFKQSVTRFARTIQPSFAWQERYYDRIIRNQDEMNRIAEYIDNNVAKWCEGMKIDY
ncbi:MAG: transposase [Bacteroidales bacterium]|nr:transposase [Bacteroidales bacterium]